MLSWSGGRTTAAAWTVSRLALPPSRFVFTREFSEPSAGPWKGTGAFPGTFGMALFFLTPSVAVVVLCADSADSEGS